MRVLIIYGTTEGQTRKIAQYLADRCREQSFDVTLVDAAAGLGGVDPHDYDAAILAARVHGGRFPHRIVRFARRHAADLSAMPSAFVSVSMMAAGDSAKARMTLSSYRIRLVRQTGWIAPFVHDAAGARFYTRHNAVGRWILGRIDRTVWGRPVDTNHDREWTDWDALGRFLDGFLAHAAPHAIAPPRPAVESAAWPAPHGLVAA